VVHGARLFESPNLADHPELAKLSIARPEQIHRGAPRHADDWVQDLDEEQVTAYSTQLDAVMEAAYLAGRDLRDVVCEVLSTQPYPLRRVMDRRGLGRFRVTQKADPRDPHDVYRSESAKESDWVMIGNHDTPPLARVIERWRREGKIEARARYLAENLEPDAARRDVFARALEADPQKLARAMLAELFASPARNVMVFFPDLFGLDAIYNRPGIVDDVNWTLRVPSDFRGAYREGLARGLATDVAGALALALRAQSPASRARTDLIATLEAASLGSSLGSQA
jgi:4-alpha-glucanotransferase